MKNFKLIKLLALFVVLITSINTAWAGNKVLTVYAGETLYFDFTAVDMSNGTNVAWRTTTGQSEDQLNGDGNGAGTVIAVYYSSSQDFYDDHSIAKTQKANYAKIPPKARTAGQNMLRFNTAGTDFEWTTARTFTSGEKIYFKDASSGMSQLSSAYWKVSTLDGYTGHVYAYFMGRTDGGADAWSASEVHVGGTYNGANGVYEFTVPKVGGNSYTWTKVLITRGVAPSFSSSQTKNQTRDLVLEKGKNLFSIWNSKGSDNKFRCGSGKYGYPAALVGDFNDWSAYANVATSTRTKDAKTIAIIPMELTSGNNFSFKILNGETEYGINNASTITSSITSYWQCFGSQGALTVTPDETGTYYFQYNRNDNYLGVYYPKARLTADKVYYFDASASTTDYWNKAAFASMFYFRYYDTEGNYSDPGPKCLASAAIGSKAGGDGPVYYQKTPDDTELIGSIIIDRYSADGSDKWNNSTQAAHGYNRTSSADNCLYITQATSWNPTVGWKTYCPPMISATLSDNGTTVISWTSGDGTSGSPYLVPSTGTIKVTASATPKVADADMTKKFDFKVNTGSGASSEQDGTGYTFNKGSLSNNTTYEISVEPYNYYNGTSGTKYTSATHIWYKALDVYTVSHSLTNMTTASGRTGSAAAAYGIAYTATFNPATGYNRPASVTVMRGSTNITANCTWNQSTGELSIPAAQVSGGDITITVAGEAQVYNITYRDKDNAAFTGTQAGAPTTHTYGSPTDLIMPTREHYEFAGWFTASNCASGQIGNTTAAQIGATAFTGDITLYAKWTEITHTVSFENDGNGTTTPNTDQTAGEVTGVAINASNSTGYSFNTWTITSGSGTFASSVSTASNTFYPLADATITASFNAKQYNITLDDNDGVAGGEGSAKVRYNEKKLTNISAPTKSGWEVDCYTLYSNGNNTVADADGNLAKGLVGYLSNEGEWIHDDNLTIYAKWKHRTYTITLNKNTPTGTSGVAGTSSFTAEYSTNNFSSISSYPTAVGYTFAGYYDDPDDGEGVLVIKDAAQSYGKNSGTIYINSDGNWISTEENLELYAHWTINNHDIDYNAPTVGGSYTIKAGDASAVSTDVADVDFGTTITLAATPATGYNFGSWTVTGATVASSTSATTTFTMPDNDVTVEVSFTAVPLTFKSDAATSSWSTASNWDPACVPTLEHDVTIEKPVSVDIAHAAAKSIVIFNNGDTKTGKLTIKANMGLEVAGTIRKTADKSSYSGTDESDLVLESSSDGNASLIFNNNNSCKATVQMYAKGSISGSTWNWQYVGTPFTGSQPLYNYYGSWMYKWDNGGWSVVYGGDELDPFVGYCLTQPSATTHYMGGTLLATDGLDQGFTISGDKVFANSWTAPIYIGGFTSTTFDSDIETIYLFNTGMAEEGSTSGSAAGTYVAVPVNSAPYSGDEFIPSMQGFFVTGSGSITFKYDELVRPADSRDIVAGQMYAPKRVEEKPDVMKIYAEGSIYNDRVVILAREDFSEEFDNGWDGEKLGYNSASPAVFVINEEGKNDAVSAIPEYEGTVVGFRAGTDSEYTLRFEYDGEETLYLNDLKEQVATPIDAMRTYTFTAEAGDSQARFIISKTPISKIITGADTIFDGVKARKQMIDGILYIIRDGRMYDATGALVK